MELDEETRELLGWGSTVDDREDRIKTVVGNDAAAKRLNHIAYEQTVKYRVAHRAAALRYYHANKSNPQVRVRGAPKMPLNRRQGPAMRQSTQEATR